MVGLILFLYLRVMKNVGLVVVFLMGSLLGLSQFTREDTLRGSITAERAWWDLTFYKLSVEVFPEEKRISGENEMRFVPIASGTVMQIDLQRPMSLDSVLFKGKRMRCEQITPMVYYVYFQEALPERQEQKINMYYSGQPKIAKNPPWDGGFTWKKSKSGAHFIATSCQGLGASVWWPCKDHMYDEVDSMRIEVTVPQGLIDVSNGRLEKTVENGDKTTFHWVVKNPINNYGVNLNIAPYVSFSETYANGEKGPLSMSYYVLPENEEKARTQFLQAPQTIEAFEYWFGPYPFYEDGYKLVEAPYLGMEHQSSVTYGNGYKNGYLGTDLSGTGWGLKWDYIIVHETGHEWFANNITYKDIADMWVHESFTTYSESLFTEYFYGKEAGAAYVIGQRKHISNTSPIAGVYGVNHEGSTDMYYKGANLLHMLRRIMNNDEKWREMLRAMNREFYHRTIDGAEMEAFISRWFSMDLSKVFDQYIRETNLPILEARFRGRKLHLRWKNVVPGFSMPVDLKINGQMIRQEVSERKKKVRLSRGGVRLLDVDEGYYVVVEVG
jgi:aminopeptidase N